MNAPRSSTLFHFTKTADVLKSIIKSGFFPRYCVEDVTWLTSATDAVALPVTCLCDIPLGRIWRLARRLFAP